jgi:hypothetical protein
MTSVSFLPLPSPPFTQMAFNLLKALPEAKPKLIKQPRPTHSKHDSSIIQFSMNGKKYGLKIFPDVWVNSSAIFSKTRTIEDINNTGYVAKVVTTFTLPLDIERNQRFVLYEFAEGELLDKYLEKATTQERKKVDTHFREMIHTFADQDICCFFRDNNDFCVTPEGKILLLDWNTLRTVSSSTPKQTIIATGLRKAEEHGLLYDKKLDQQA